MSLRIHHRRRSLVGVLGSALVLGTLVVPALSTTAAAAELEPSLTAVTFTHARDNNGDGILDPVTAQDPLQKDYSFRLGVDLELPVPLAVGDTFAVDFPDEIRGSVNPAFPLVTEAGATIGTCAVGPAEFSCELTDPMVEDWESTTPFRVFFNATATSASTATTLPFTVIGGGTFDLPGPAGGIVIGDGTDFPTEPRKEGWVSTGEPGQIQWVVYLPAPTHPTEISFTDTLGAGESQDLVPGSISVHRTTQWNPQNLFDANTTTYPRAEVDVELSGDLQSFSLTFPTHAGAVAYWVQYRSTVPADVEFGDQFSNSVAGETIDLDETVRYNSTAGGTGGGSALPDLVLSKVAVDEPEARSYEFTVSCTTGGVVTDYSVAVVSGGTATVRDLAVGTVCTITEVDSFGAEVTYSPGSVVTISDNAQHVVAVTATNVFTPPSPTSSSSSLSPSLSTPPSPTVSTTAAVSSPSSSVSVQSTVRSTTPLSSSTESSSTESSSTGSSSTRSPSVVSSSNPTTTNGTPTVPPRDLPKTGSGLPLAASLVTGGLLALAGGLILFMSRRTGIRRH